MVDYVLQVLRPFLEAAAALPLPVRYGLTMLLGIIPFIECRMAMFIAVSVGMLSPIPAFVAGAVGNIIGVALAIPVFEMLVVRYRASHPKVDAWVGKLLSKTRKEHSHLFNRFGAVMLIVMTMLPLPSAGAYTGVIVSYVFGVPRRYAFLVLSLGVIGAGLVGLLMIVGVLGAMRFW